jgi:hypothetical protein
MIVGCSAEREALLSSGWASGPLGGADGVAKTPLTTVLKISASVPRP